MLQPFMDDATQPLTDDPRPKGGRRADSLVLVNTGDGKGKTTAAIGTMVRAAGRGLKCCMVQFMKSSTDRYGEH